MAPKAKVKAKARAVGVGIRRPAARLRGILRRPAGHGEGSLWDQGLEGPLCEVPPMALGPGCLLAVTKADYFGGPAQVAGRIIKLEVEDGEVTVQMKVTGTTNEQVLRACTARPQQLFRCHICPEGCGMQTTGDYMLHAVMGRKLNPGGDERWTSNLEVKESGQRLPTR